MKKLCLLLIMTCFSQVKIYATHNNAGEITYKYIGDGFHPYLYEITVTTYTRYVSGPGQNSVDRCELEVYFGDGTHAIVPRVNGPSSSCPTAADGEMVKTETRMNIYKIEHDYPGPSEYTIYVEDPNRNAGIINIPSSEMVSFSLTASLIINPILGTNTTAYYLEYPNTDGCVGEIFTFNSALFDPDGDSLSYELEPCMANGAPISGYTFPANLQLDPQTGSIFWLPTLIGEYSILVRVKEYRTLPGTQSRVLVGSTGRDMNFRIGVCSGSLPLLSTVSDTTILAGDSLAISVNASLNGSANTDLAAVGAPLKSILINGTAANFNTSTGTGTKDGVFTWQTTLSQGRKAPYLLVFKASDPLYPERITYKAMNIFVTRVDLGLNENISSPTVEIFPNPSDSHFQITIPPGSKKLEIYDVLGSKVFEKNDLNGLMSFDFDGKTLKEGVYFLNLVNSKGVATAKLIKN